eukprot:TRINITY_DN300_c0_g1_i1.p1 TRINITY_DN300_c0_g1~~TRINITY_DN300_c0_g1_i1.p1  ORF type:complete len:160 (+),score=55.23 TRINITY_DN300_c0_g1_i1:269-748(+)
MSEANIDNSSANLASSSTSLTSSGRMRSNSMKQAKDEALSRARGKSFSSYVRFSPSSTADSSSSSSSSSQIPSTTIRTPLESDIMEPPPQKITYGDEVKGFLKEKWGRIVNDKMMEKEGLAYEKAAHPVLERQKAEERLRSIVGHEGASSLSRSRAYTQ